MPNAKAPSPPRAGTVTDATEDELEAKMVDADLAGNKTLCAAYQHRLERLRAEKERAAAKVLGNVIILADRRSGETS
jgi:hypothetical protein